MNKCLSLCLIALSLPSVARAQAVQEHVHETGARLTPAAREGSGTSWLPDESPMYAVHAMRGDWRFMTHGNAFLQYLRDSGPRGHEQTGSINWVMASATRQIGSGRLQFRGMLSFEPWTIDGCGYPNQLASGELCGGEPIHDRQHPHDLFMELAARYEQPLGKALHLELYGGPAGEPALGPVAFPHRLSAMPNPLAPIGHHWLDATHVSFGVATAGLGGARWKAEASAFNGREPDDARRNLDLGALDSWSGRVWFLPGPRWALQVSGGRLKDAEADEHSSSRTDVDRVTASATYHRAFSSNSPIPQISNSPILWATTVAWGRNAEHGSNSSNALLVETSVTSKDRDALFARVEAVAKTAHDLGLETDGEFTVSKVQGGYTRYFPAWRALQGGIGASVSVSFVPASLAPEYGGRVVSGYGAFLTLRPAAAGR